MKRLLPFIMAAAMLALLSSCRRVALPAESEETSARQSVTIEETTENPASELFSELTQVITEKTSVPVYAAVRPSEVKTSAAETTVKTTEKTTEKTTVIITEKPAEPTTAPTTAAEKTTAESVTENSGKDEKGLPAYSPEKDVVELHEKVNLHRAAHGKRILKLDNVLCRLAYVRAGEQAVSFGHKRPDRSSWVGVFAQYGVERGSAGENLFWLENYDYETQDVVRVTFEGWKDSPGHNENMLEGDWAYTGLARFDSGNNRYYVQIFTDGSYGR